MRIKKTLILLLGAAAILIISGCSSAANNSANIGNTVLSYHQISQEKAREMMARNDGHVVVDVRRTDEYEAGHIPGAILIPNESIDKDRPSELPDLDQIILIYCRSGNRSKQASQKLADMGYKNIYEFGGIITWTGDTVTGSSPYPESRISTLVFSSFDGGGPSYTLRFTGPEDVISYSRSKEYGNPDHDKMDGSPFDVIFTFVGLKPGKTSFVIEERSPITTNRDITYSVTVDEELKVTVELLKTEEK